jgi:hypothetical protein
LKRREQRSPADQHDIWFAVATANVRVGCDAGEYEQWVVASANVLQSLPNGTPETSSPADLYC